MFLVQDSMAENLGVPRFSPKEGIANRELVLIALLSIAGVVYAISITMYCLAKRVDRKKKELADHVKQLREEKAHTQHLQRNLGYSSSNDEAPHINFAENTNL